MKYYEKIAPGYNELHGKEQRKKMAIIKENLTVRPEDRLLDVGCGTGISSNFYCEVFGLEPSKNLLRQSNLPEDHKIVAKAEDIPFDDNFFDIVISVTAIHNFDDIEKGLKEMKRVGKKKFVFSILKNSPKFNEIKKLIQKNFKVKKKIEEEKDVIFFV